MHHIINNNHLLSLEWIKSFCIKKVCTLFVLFLFLLFFFLYIFIRIDFFFYQQHLNSIYSRVSNYVSVTDKTFLSNTVLEIDNSLRISYVRALLLVDRHKTTLQSDHWYYKCRLYTVDLYFFILLLFLGNSITNYCVDHN